MVTKFTNHVLNIASEYIPKSRRIPRAYNHQWLNDECLRLLEEKYAAEGTLAYADKQRLCTEGLLRHHQLHIERIRNKICKLPASS